MYHNLDMKWSRSDDHFDMKLLRLNSELRDVAELATAPLKFCRPIGPVVRIDTTVIGEARNIAQIDIYFGSQKAWAQTLMQVTPNATLPWLQIGYTSIVKGASLVLTIPTGIQTGSVFFSATIMNSRSGSNVPYSAMVADWPLTSSQVPTAPAAARLPPGEMAAVNTACRIAPARLRVSVAAMVEDVEAGIEEQVAKGFSSAFQFHYALGPKLAVAGTIRGDRREIGVLQIRYGDLPLYSLSLTPDSPVQTMPYGLVVDDVLVIEEGASLRLAPPTIEQSGSILLDAVINTRNGKQRFTGNVALWPPTPDIG